MLQIPKNDCRTTVLGPGWFKRSDLAAGSDSFTFQMSTVFKLVSGTPQECDWSLLLWKHRVRVSCLGAGWGVRGFPPSGQ